MKKLIHEKYLPFEEDQLKDHFIDRGKKNADFHIKNFNDKIQTYLDYESNPASYNNDDLATARQVEKDETIWTLSALLSLYYPKKNSRTDSFIKLMTKVFGEKPPLKDFDSWEKCFEGDWKLYFEPNLPSPDSYKKWLQKNAHNQIMIPYLEDKAKTDDKFRGTLEGATNVDALVLGSNGFAILIEAKVLSDISYMITYDDERNQLIRNIDIMLENHRMHKGIDLKLANRDSDKSLFLLLTPEKFRKNKKSRLYGYKYEDYKSNIQNLKNDLRHRNLSDLEWERVQEQIGWITWEDIRSIEPEACKWLI